MFAREIASLREFQRLRPAPTLSIYATDSIGGAAHKTSAGRIRRAEKYNAINALHIEAWSIANKPPDAPDTEVKEFRDKEGYAAKHARKWTEAEAAVAE